MVGVIGTWITIIVSVAGILWKVSSFLETQAINSRRPFLDLQLKLYQEAVQTAGILATSSDQDALEKATKQFWEFYWGELGMVENGGIKSEQGGVEAAMKRFGDQLVSDQNNRKRLQVLSLDLAHACRNSLASSWGVTDWQAPIYTAAKDAQDKPVGN